MPHGKGRQCKMTIPEPLVAQMKSDPNGLIAILSRVAKEYGLSTAINSFDGTKHYTIMGPNEEILEMAIANLQTRYSQKEDEQLHSSSENDERQEVWKFQGDYAVKATHLFQYELEELRAIPSVKITFSPQLMEIRADYTYVDEAKIKIEQMQSEIDNLYQEEAAITDAEIDHLREFMKKKQKFDRTAVIILNEQTHKFTVFGKTEISVRKLMDVWAAQSHKGQPQSPPLSVAPSFASSNVGTHSHFKSEMELPKGIIGKLENQRDGMDYIISQTEKEFGIKIDYIRKKRLKFFGPNMDMLELAAQTLIHKYIIKILPTHGIWGQLQGKNAVWNFLGNYAKIVAHLFSKELHQLERIRTVTIKATPGRIRPHRVDVLCSYRVIEKVKYEIEQLVGLIHNLFEKEIEIPDEHDQINNVKNFVAHKSNTFDYMYIYNDNERKLWIFGKTENLMRKAMAKIKADRMKFAHDELIPDKYWHMHRQLYETRINKDIVQKLEAAPGGIMQLIHKIEKEFGVTALYHINKEMVLISQTKAVLELAQSTIEARYIQHTKDEILKKSETLETLEISDTETGETHLENEIVKIPKLDSISSKVKSNAHSTTGIVQAYRKNVTFIDSVVIHALP